MPISFGLLLLTSLLTLTSFLDAGSPGEDAANFITAVPSMVNEFVSPSAKLVKNAPTRRVVTTLIFPASMLFVRVMGFASESEIALYTSVLE